MKTSYIQTTADWLKGHLSFQERSKLAIQEAVANWVECPTTYYRRKIDEAIQEHQMFLRQ